MNLLSGFNGSMLKANKVGGRLAISSSSRLSVKAAMEVDIGKVCASVFFCCINVAAALRSPLESSGKDVVTVLLSMERTRISLIMVLYSQIVPQADRVLIRLDALAPVSQIPISTSTLVNCNVLYCSKITRYTPSDLREQCFLLGLSYS